MSESLRAIVAEEIDGKVRGRLKELTVDDLPEGDVLVAIAYSTLNYKDGLAVTGTGRIARSLPMVCGIDFAGTVVESTASDYRAGDKVVLTGWGLSETRWGGYSQRQRVKSEWLVPLPEGLSLKQAMAVGTAGFTAMLGVMALEGNGVRPGDGKVLVTGAGGGVGSVSVALLADLGYEVTASTGRSETHDYLRGLGAAEIIDRATLAEKGRPFDKERWAGAIDTVGGQTLATVLAQSRYGGVVAACGLAGGTDLPATVLPFILRGVKLIGIESVYCPKEPRLAAWQRLARDLDLGKLAAMTTIEPMSRVPELAEDILKGRVRGRVVIDVNA